MPKTKAQTAGGGAKPKKKANGYKFPEKLPKGEVLVDSAKKQWVLGESIGQGGFGEIYCASEPGLGNKWPYVIKIEPHENGPLFMEKNFYIKVAKPDDVKAWKQKEGVKTLGIPTYLGSGTYMYKGQEKYRFLVIDRYGKDLWSLFVKYKSFPPHTVYRIALQILEALRYIHGKDYVHGDIKGQNLLLGLAPGTEDQVFLVDFGLACRYSQKEFQRDPKQAHNGTIEYTSCDWHMGVPTRRGDLEILGYNLLHWLSGSLPWEKDLAKCEVVHKKKRELMDNVETYIPSNFSNIPKVIIDYMAYVSKLKHDEQPNYKLIKDLFTKELKKIGSPATGPLEFEAGKSGPAASGALKKTPKKAAAGEDVEQPTAKRGVAARSARRSAAAAVVDSSEEEDEVPPPKVTSRGKAAGAKPAAAAAKAKPSAPASTSSRTTQRAASAKPGCPIDEFFDDDMFGIEGAELDLDCSDCAKPTNSRPKKGAAAKVKQPAPAATSSRTTKRAVKPRCPIDEFFDDDMFGIKGAELDLDCSDCDKPKNSRSKTSKTKSNGASKPTRGTKRPSPKSTSAQSPKKRSKSAAPATKKLDYRDAPKCLLPNK